MMEHVKVLTIGHSTHSMGEFVDLLRRHQVTAVADVRSSPFSRYAPQFNERSLKTELPQRGVQYVFLGRELGARSADADCYVNGRVQYARLAETTAFHKGIERILSGAQSQRIALMCTEKDPLDCHRTVLVARKIVEEGVQVGHILADGSLETHDDAMLRLLDKLDMRQPSLFRSTEEQIADALARQEERIAYVDLELAAASDESS